MISVLGAKLHGEPREVPYIERDDHAPLPIGKVEDLFVREPTEIVPLEGGDDVVAAPSELLRDRRRPHLVEQQPQPRSFCSRRHSRSTRSASERFQASQSSISCRNSAQ